MDSMLARKLYAEYACAMAYVDVETENGDRAIGSAFHVGDGVFVTARHVVERSRIVEVKIVEPVGVSSQEFFLDIMKTDVDEKQIERYDGDIKSALGFQPLFKHFLEPFDIAEGPYFAEDDALDVAVFRVRDIHPAASVVKLGIHWDDWVYHNVWHLTDSIILGYPPIPFVPEPVLVAARAEVHTVVIPRHAPAVHFLLSAMPRGGFSGGVAIHESGDALGVVTSSLIKDAMPEQLGFFAVLSIESIVKCLEYNKLYPGIQKKHYDMRMGFGESGAS